jgi:hypothetical protein
LLAAEEGADCLRVAAEQKSEGEADQSGPNGKTKFYWSAP